MEGFLNESERIDLLNQHRRERDKRVCDRIKAVLLYDKGWHLQKISEALLISHEAIRQHLLDYEAGKKLKPKNGGSEEKLNKLQKEILFEELRQKTYTKAKDVAMFVLEEFGVYYTPSGMTTFLKKNGFSYKKPAVIPGKASQEIQEAWIQYYKNLKNSLSDKEVICFMDGVHPTHNTKPSYGWIETGVNKEIRTNSGRQRVNLSGAIDIDSKKVIVQEDETLNAESTTRFLQKVENGYPMKEVVHLFCDNARYYRNKEVMRYLKNSKISLHFLPPYSPNLNPIERLWKFMNEKVVNNRYYETFKEFKSNIFCFLESLAAPPSNILKSLHKRITDNFRAIRTC